MLELKHLFFMLETAHCETLQPKIHYFVSEKENSRRQLLTYPTRKPSLKIGSVNKAFLFWYWLRPKYFIFFRNNTFLFYKIESWNFQHLFEKKIRETSKNFDSTIRQSIEKMEIKIVWISWMSWNFVRFDEILFQTHAEIFNFLSSKTKKFYS